MRIKTYRSDFFGDSFESDPVANGDIKSMCRAANIFRVGLEYRISRNVSARAGYNYQASSVTNRAKDGQFEIPTAGTDPSFNLNNDTNNFSLGIGYRYGGWYIDAAYQYTRQTGSFHAFTTYGDNIAPSAKVTTTHNNIVISTGIRF